MFILTNDNETFDLNQIGHELPEPVHYSVFDYSDKANCDYYFRSLVMTESFSSVTIEFQIGNNKIMLPQEWSIILGDPETGDIELISVDEINTRNFHVLSLNPIRGMHRFLPIKPVDVFTDVSWTVPKLAFHNFLMVPLTSGKNPDCIFLLNEKDQKRIQSLELGMLI